MAVAINCDMGESFGLYKMGDDEGIMPYITVANVACGFHASDPVVMHKTVRLAKQHGVKVGAHPSFPDLQGFGRREMRIPRAELTDLLIYQIGALRGFLEVEGVALNHIKPHGVLYGMAARQEEVAHAVCDAAEVFGVALFGMAGTLHERVYQERGFAFVSEFYADLDYDEKRRPDHHARASRGRSAAGGGALPARGQGGQGQEHRRQRHTGARGFGVRALGHAERGRYRQGGARGARPLHGTRRLT